MKNDSAKTVLDAICHGAQLGVAAIEDLMPKSDSPDFRADLRTQQNGYEQILSQARFQLGLMGAQPKTLSKGKKTAMKLSVEMNTILEQDTSHLAEMMINGSNMGIINMTKVLNGYSDPDPEVKSLGDQLIRMEKDNLERMKVYLG